MSTLDFSKFRLSGLEEERIAIARAVAKDNPQKYTVSLVKGIHDTIAEKLNTEDESLIEKTVWLSIYYYFAYGCSTKEFLMWDLLHKTDTQASNYITVHKKKFYRDHLNNPKEYYIFNDKFEAYKLFKDAYKRDVICIKNEDDFPVFCNFVKKHPSFVVKPRSLSQGHGVFVNSIESLEEFSLRACFKHLLDKGIEYTKTFKGYNDPALVLEEIIIQDPAMAKFHPASINSVRINTLRIDGKVHIFKPWFKIGRGGQFITSATYNTFDAGIDAKTGVVYTPGVTEDREIAVVHPDTGERILGFEIPRWDEAIALTTELAGKVDNMNFIGWDVVLTPNGWCIMEGNASGGLMWQLYEDKGNQSEFEELIGWKLQKDFWWEE